MTVQFWRTSFGFCVGDNKTSGTGISTISYSGDITIPLTYEGEKVVEIGFSAFKDAKITKVTIYAQLTAINKWAFWGCRSLLSINIPPSVVFIGHMAFYSTKDDQNIPSGALSVVFEKGSKITLFSGTVFGGKQVTNIYYYEKTEPQYKSSPFYEINGRSCINIYAEFLSTFCSKSTIKITSQNAPKLFTKSRKNNKFYAFWALLIICLS